MEYEKTLPQVEEKTLKTKSEHLPIEKSYLVAMTGPHAGTVFTLTQGVMVAGRVPQAEICLQDTQVSRKHAQFSTNLGETKVTDLGSTNGTIVNGKRIDREQLISDGDEVQIGDTNFRFSIHNPIDGNKLGLNNHGYFETRFIEELDRAARYKRQVSILMIGPKLDPQEINEKIPDLTSRYPTVVNYLQKSVRGMDLLAHYGKYELELLLPETNKEHAILLAEKITQETRFDKECPISVGVATFPEDGKTADILIEKSRKALRIARDKKSDRVVQITEDPRRLMMSNKKEIIVRSEKMRELFELVDRIAKSTITVLIQGETGVGKEVVAESLHTKSDRVTKPLVSLNCAALTETLLESELFGHERGAFTGADQTKIGLFETANGGTIFLDEIGEMPQKTQAKLLRVLQAKKIMRVGSNKELDTDVRVVAATNRKLEEQVEKKLFREDLFYRLNAATITIPPLRERKEEIPYLATTFVKQCCDENGLPSKELSPEALDVLMKYNWPGNIRELRNTIERSVVISEGETIFKEALTSRLTSEYPSERPQHHQTMDDLDGGDGATVVGDMKEIVSGYEKELIVNALKKSQWNQTKASELLNVPRRTLVSKIKKYKIKKDY